MTKLTALVVEEEAAVRAHATDALNDAGFRVFEAADAPAAMRVLKTDGADIDAVVTDINTPDPSGGPSLARQVRSRWPWIRLLLTSARTRPEASELPSNAGFLPKPVDVTRVASRLRELIFPRKRGF